MPAVFRRGARAVASLVALTSIASIAGAQLLPAGPIATAAKAAEPQPVSYAGQSVVRVLIESAADLELMFSLSDDMFSHRIEVGDWADFRLTDDAALERIRNAGLRHEVLIDDLGVIVEAERRRLAQREQGGMVDGVFFDDYRTLSEVSDYIDQLVVLRPDLAERVEVGTSLRGRSIFGVRISSAAPGARPAILIHGCQHAREWITVMVNMYIADTLIRSYDSDPAIRDLVDRVEFIVIPVVNPDGYEFTWTNQRLWRKNRRSWHGVDLNRNWSVGWGGPGSSGMAISETYRGEAPFSEPETAAMRDFFLANPHIAAHIDFHSFSQLILEPWGYTPDTSAAFDFFDRVGAEMSNAIASVHGTQFIHGPTWTTIYPASGVASDWTYGARGVFGLGIELRDTGRYGFLLPPDQIVPSGEEIMPAMIALGEFVATERPDLLLNVSPLFAGEIASMTATQAEPDTIVYFAVSGAGTQPTFVPQLGLALDLRNPSLAGFSRADQSGAAELTGRVPAGAAGARIWIQAAQYGVKSAVSEEQIN